MEQRTSPSQGGDDKSRGTRSINFGDERKEASRPKKKFLAADVSKMHDILSKNMYKIRQKTMAYTNKYNLPDDSKTREILIRRHASIRRSLRASSFRELPAQNISRSQKYFSLQPGGDLETAFALRRRSHGGSGDVDNPSARVQSSNVTPRSSSRSLVPMRRLNTIEEQPAASARPHSLPPGVDVLNEGGPGSLGGSSLRGRRAPVPASRRRISDQVAGDEDSDPTGETEEPVRPPQLPPPRGWVPENQDPREGAGNPLLRHSSQGSGGS